jgi:exosome complex component RRP41
MKRADKRKPDELRPLKIEAGIIRNANGSALVSMGMTTAIAAVYGPRLLYPKHRQSSYKAAVNTYYYMIPFSTTERVRPGPSRRSMEICKVTREALESVVFLEEFPKTTIDVYINILQADAGTRTAGINAASVAMADAGIPMRDMVAAVASGKINNQYVLDLDGKEEEETKCDIPVAYVPREDKITLLQMDGDISRKDVQEIIKLSIKGCKYIYEKQKEALKKRWMK